MTQLPNPLDHREAAHPIESLFLKRWSPRAMSGAELADADVNRLFEAARWAPSTYNEQEWRFLYAKNGDPQWEDFFGLLMEANQAWCDKAGMLIVVLSHKTFERNGKPNPVHTLDTGMAVQNLLLQAASMNLVGHAMAGFNRGQAKQVLQVPDDYEVEAMIAIGHPGDVDALSPELQEREVPTGRKPINEIARSGKFAF